MPKRVEPNNKLLSVFSIKHILFKNIKAFFCNISWREDRSLFQTDLKNCIKTLLEEFEFYYQMIFSTGVKMNGLNDFGFRV